MPKRPAIKSRLSNVVAGVVALGLAVVLLAVTFQVLGDMMARVVPASWITTDTTGVPFHPNRPSLPLDGAMAFLLTMVLTPPVAMARVAFARSRRASALP
jgi:hypothetical protein